jgi:hypothetical protein
MQQKEKEFRDTLRYLDAQRMHTPRLPIETPGPHRLQAKTPRQQEMKLQQKIDLQNQAEADLHTPANTTDTHLVEVFKQLTQVMKENNTSDTTEPAHFNGSDERWDEFYSQLRTYLSAKNWFTTFEHKEGPGDSDLQHRSILDRAQATVTVLEDINTECFQYDDDINAFQLADITSREMKMEALKACEETLDCSAAVSKRYSAISCIGKPTERQCTGYPVKGVDLCAR